MQISGNRIDGDHYGIFLEGDGAAVRASLHGNAYHSVSCGGAGRGLT